MINLYQEKQLSRNFLVKSNKMVRRIITEVYEQGKFVCFPK